MSTLDEPRFIDGDPPPSTYGWSGIAKQLRDRPRQWAVVAENTEDDPRAAWNAKRYFNKGSPHMPKAEFEAVLVDGKMYARYLGEGVQ